MEDNVITLSPEQIEVQDLMTKVEILTQVKNAFAQAKDNDFTGISLLHKTGIVTLKSYLDNTEMYGELVNDLIEKIQPLIDKEVETHTARVTTLNEIITNKTK